MCKMKIKKKKMKKILLACILGLAGAIWHVELSTLGESLQQIYAGQNSR